MQYDPHRRIEVIFKTVIPSLLDCSEVMNTEERLTSLETMRLKAHNLLRRCNDIDPIEIENKFQDARTILEARM